MKWLKSTECVSFEVRDSVARITLNRPDKRNALSAPTLRELHQALLEADDRRDANVILLSGAGKDFCAGYDLTLRPQAFDPRVDQPFAELVEVENADDENAETGKVQEENAPGEAGEDVVAEEAPDRHGQPRQHFPREAPGPFSKGHRLLDFGV